MVTTQQARQQLTTQRTALESQRRQLAQARQQIQQAELRALTRAELQVRTRDDIIKRKQQQEQLSNLQKSQLSELKPIESKIKTAEKQLTSFGTQISRAEEQQKIQRQKQTDIEQAFKAFDRGALKPGASKETIRIFDQIQDSARAQKEFRTIITELEDVQLKPIIKEGRIEGFEDTLKKQSIELSGLDALSESRLKQLEQKGFLTLETVLPKSTVEVAPNLKQQLQTEILKATPDLKLGSGEIERIIEKGVGTGIGTKNFAFNKFQGQIKGLRDAKGNPLFTDAQAKGLARITEEVTVNLIAGKGVGKGFALFKGGTSKILPKALTGNLKFQRTVSFLEIAGGTALGVVAANQIKKSFERGGVDEAILTTIGFVSFGAGFGKTGLKSNAKAQKEFKQIAKTLKKSNGLFPKGKKGSAQILVQRKKLKKKKKKTKKDKKTIEELELELELKAKLERRLLQAKTPEEQVKILLEIWRKLKTPIQKRNFQKLLLELTNSNIFKLKNLFLFEPKIKGVRTKVRQTQKQKQRIRKLKKETQSFFKQRTRTQQQILKQKQKINQLIKQKAPQAVITAQTIKLASSQKSVQKQTSKQASKLLSQQSQIFNQRQLSQQAQLQKSKLVARIATAQKLTLKQRRKLARVVRRPPRKIKKPRKPGIILKIPLPELKPTDLIKAIKKLGKKKAVDIVVGMKTGRQRVIGRGLPPYKALRKAQRFVDSNIEASFRLKPTGKKPKQKDQKPFNLGVKFRGSKVNPFFQVEKRRFRLDTSGEKRQIKSFKGKVPSNFFPAIKKKKKRRKKK